MDDEYPRVIDYVDLSSCITGPYNLWPDPLSQGAY